MAVVLLTLVTLFVLVGIGGQEQHFAVDEPDAAQTRLLADPASRGVIEQCRGVRAELKRREGPRYYVLRQAVASRPTRKDYLNTECPRAMKASARALNQLGGYKVLDEPTKPDRTERNSPLQGNGPPETNCEAIHDYLNAEFDAGSITESEYDSLLDELFETCYAFE